MEDTILLEKLSEITLRYIREYQEEELKARYGAMPQAEWFRAAHEGRSLGDGMKVD